MPDKTMEILGIGQDGHRFADIIQEGIWTVDSNGIIAFANSHLVRILGYLFVEMVGKPLTDFLTKPYHRRCREILKCANSDTKEVFECVLVRKDGIQLDIKLSISPVINNGQKHGFVVLVTQIGESKKNSQNRAEQSVVEILESITDAFYAVDADWRLTYVNRKTEESWNISRDELIGKKLWDIFPHYEKNFGCQELHRAALERTPVTFENFSSVLHTWIEANAYPKCDGGLSVYFRDITARKSAEKALEESEHRFRCMFENHQAMMMLIEPESGAIVDANLAAVEFYGYGREQLCAMTIQEINALSGDEVAAMRLKTLKEQQGHFIFPHRLYNGEDKWVEVHSTPIEIQGNLLLFSIIHDITDRKKAEEDLRASKLWLEEAQRESEERYQDLFLKSPVAIILHDGVRILQANPAIGAILGYEDPNDLIGIEVLNIVASEYRSLAYARIRLLLENEGSMSYRDFKLLRKDGSLVYVETISGICRYRGHKVIQVIMHDITERKELEMKLTNRSVELSHALVTLETMLETIPIGVVVAEAGDERISYYSPAAKGIVGGPLQGTATGPKPGNHRSIKFLRPDRTEIPPDDWPLARALRRNEFTDNEEIILQHTNGHEVTTVINCAPVRDDQGRVLRAVASIVNITKRKQLEMELHVSNAQLHQLTKQMTTTLEDERSMIARELHDEAGQSLTALKIYIELILKGLPAEAQGLRKRMGDAVKLTEDTLGKIRRLAQELRPPSLDALGLNPTLEDLCHEFGQRVGMNIVYQGCELPLLDETARITLYRFLQEALTNIAKHAKADQVRVTLDYQEQQIVLTVKDNGIGFNVSNEAHKSKGMGLVGMMERFIMQRGNLLIDSKPGCGTCLVGMIPWEVGP